MKRQRPEVLLVVRLVGSCSDSPRDPCRSEFFLRVGTCYSSIFLFWGSVLVLTLVLVLVLAWLGLAPFCLMLFGPILFGSLGEWKTKSHFMVDICF